MDKLKGSDYLNLPLIELQSHYDFSYKAYMTIALIGSMTTEEIEQLNLTGENE